MRLFLLPLAPALVALPLAGCSSPDATPPAPGAPDATTADAPSGDDAAPAPATDASAPWAPSATNADAAAMVAARPYTLHVPSGYDATRPTPLLVMFHGYGSNAAVEEGYMQLTATSDSATFLYAYTDGTVDDSGSRFWNATDGCCNDYGSTVDDVAYFGALVDDVMAKYHVDPKRIFALGHSNGAFMAHRLACDDAARVAGIVSLAGATWTDPAKCNPAGLVSILDVHGNADTTISYDGGVRESGATYPSEAQTMATWAQKDGCTGALTPTTDTYDIDRLVPGSETTVQKYAGCPAGIDVELWTMQASGHVPILAHPTWGELVWGFLSSHPKP